MRINKYIAERLGISRRKADALLAAGRITVNGSQPNPGMDITDDHHVLIDKRALPAKKSTQYVLLHKPVGYVCSREGQGSLTIYDLLPHSLDHLNPVGRLDKDSSGLLLLTNDGTVHNQLTHPSHEKEKQYAVTLNKPLANDAITAVTTRGVKLRDGNSKFDIVPINMGEARYTVILREGRNRQIRRTFNALGYKIINLTRTQIGNYELGNLPVGKFIEIQPK